MLKYQRPNPRAMMCWQCLTLGTLTSKLHLLTSTTAKETPKLLPGLEHRCLAVEPRTTFIRSIVHRQIRVLHLPQVCFSRYTWHTCEAAGADEVINLEWNFLWTSWYVWSHFPCYRSRERTQGKLSWIVFRGISTQEYLKNVSLSRCL